MLKKDMISRGYKSLIMYMKIYFVNISQLQKNAINAVNTAVQLTSYAGLDS